MNRTRLDLAEIVARRLDVSMYAADNCVDEILKSIMSWVSDGDEIQLRGFGTLFPQKQEARKARVVKENRMIEVPSRIKPKFKPSKNFLDKCNNK